MKQWVVEQLQSFGLEGVDELVEYLLQCQDEQVLIEYLTSLLGPSERTNRFLNEFEKKRKEQNLVYEIAKQNKNTQGKEQNKKMRKIKTKKGVKVNSNQKLQPSDGFIRNCLCCGKVVMDYAKCCPFCEWSPSINPEKFRQRIWGNSFREALLSSSRIKRRTVERDMHSNEETWDEISDESSGSELNEIDHEILARKERLLELERNAASRLAIFDDQRDYYDMSSNIWLDEEQLEKQISIAIDSEGKVVYRRMDNSLQDTERPYHNPFLPGPSPVFIPSNTTKQHKSDQFWD
eukprot:jgi/Galph1/739/GphlegSOOS_G5482.1